MLHKQTQVGQQKHCMKHHSYSWEDKEGFHKAAVSAEASYGPQGTFSIVRAGKGLLLASV